MVADVDSCVQCDSVRLFALSLAWGLLLVARARVVEEQRGDADAELVAPAEVTPVAGEDERYVGERLVLAPRVREIDAGHCLHMWRRDDRVRSPHRAHLECLGRGRDGADLETGSLEAARHARAHRRT